MPLQATSGAASYDAFGGNGVAVVPTYIEDVMSTWLYKGNNSTQSIVNNIDLSTKGGMVWIKNRELDPSNNFLFDTLRGAGNYLRSNQTSAEGNFSPLFSSFNTNGFSLNGTSSDLNSSSYNYVSWTFRKQPKFFDVVTYTGNGTAGRTVAHNLGSVPGVIIVKRINAADPWRVYHRSLGNTQHINLDTAEAASTGSPYWNSTTPTSTVFSLGSNADVNGSGSTYVAYLFAHDAGGFGLTGTDNVISCGSVVGASQVEVNLGYEPQWILVKNASAAQDWWLVDNMRGLPVQGTDTSYNASNLRPNLSDAETTGFSIAPSATGFKANVLSTGQTYIYIAIRRGPMKVPTLGTSVFAPVATSGNPSSITAGFPVDFALGKEVKNGTGYGNYAIDRLRGGGVLLQTNTTGAEYTSQTFKFDSNTQFLQSAGGLFYGPSIYWLMRRAPSFFDEVCYTGTGSALTVTHNLAAVPELMIMKLRDTTQGWLVYHSFIGNTGAMTLNTASGNITTSSGLWNNTTPTSSVFTVGSNTGTNGSGFNVVAYLFATCAGVSKVGNYTGNGSSQTINCGFAGGARFVLIKRVEVDVSGDWYVWDSARGIVAGNDPHLSLNDTAAEITTDDSVDTNSTGFVVNQVAATNVNVSSATYIFLAIA